MKAYQDLLRLVFEHGQKRQDRTGVGTIGVFGAQARFDLTAGFPLLTTKKVHWKSIVEELLWFLSGSTNATDLQAKGVSIWNEWADKEGDLGRIYGAQWTDWAAPDGRRINQIAELIEGIRNDPYSRRHIVTAWNPGELNAMALPPCHALFQFHVSNNGDLRCQLYQRSADLFLGVPFNIASYALLTHMIAHVCNLRAREFIHTFGDLHIYQNHLDQVRWQLTRTPRRLPQLRLSPKVQSVFDFTAKDIELIDYNPHPAIRAPIAV